MCCAKISDDVCWTGGVDTAGGTDRETDGAATTHKYKGSIVVLSTSKSVEPNEEQKKMTSGFQQGIFCKHGNSR